MSGVDEMDGPRPGRRAGWFVLAVVAALGGVIAAVAYGITWFGHTAGDCGVVRVYEDIFGIFVLGVWLSASALGVGLALYGLLKRSRTSIPGAVIVVIAAAGMALVHMRTVQSFREADYSLKSTAVLMEFLLGEEMDKRQHAAFELGERRAVEAAPAFCAIVDDSDAYINLKLNAVDALRKICAPPPPGAQIVDQAVASLIGSLREDDEFVPRASAEALGEIGDARAVRPLAVLLGDRKRDRYVRDEAVTALWRIGGKEAIAALREARAACEDKDIAGRIDGVLGRADGGTE